MSEHDDPVLLTETRTAPEAAILVQALADEGIRAVYNGTALTNFAAETPAWARVLVDRSDLEAARAILAEKKRAGGADVDWSAIDVGEPTDS